MIFSIKRAGSTGVVALGILFFTATAHAQGILSSTAPIGTGRIVSGCCPSVGCAYTIGRIASTMDVNRAFGWISTTLNSQIWQMGRAYTSGQKKVSAVFNTRFEKQNDMLRSISTSYGAAREKSKNHRMFGPQSRAYASWDRSGFIKGEKAAGSLDYLLRKRVRGLSKSMTKRKQRGIKLSQVNTEDIDPQHIFPVGGLLDRSEGKKMITTLETITNAFPAVQLSEAQKTRKAGRAYEALGKAHGFRAQIAEGVLADITANYLPVIDVDEEALKMWTAAGGKGVPEGMEDNRMSQVGYLGFLIRARFANDDWRTGPNGLHGMTQTGLLREMASVNALRMAIKQKMLRRSQQLAFLAALQVSGKAANRSIGLERILYKASMEE